MDDLSLLCTEEISEVFRNYRSVLKLSRFKTPLQRISALSNQQQSIKLEHIRQFQQNQTTSLLPLGPKTRLSVDVLYLVATSPKSWRLRVPFTLISKADSLALLRTDQNGKVLVKTMKKARAVRGFSKGLMQNATITGFPKCIHKCSSAQPRLLFHINETDEVWRNHTLEVQRLQEFVIPPHASVSLTRVHWKQASRRGNYYVLRNERETVTRKSSHGRVRSLADLMGADRSEAEFVVNAKAANVVSVKRTKPEPQLDLMAEEVCLLLESTLCKDHEKVDELVLDFVQDSQGRPVLLSCEGFTFTTLKRALTRKMLPMLMQESMTVSEAEVEIQEEREERPKSVIQHRKSKVKSVLPQRIFVLRPPSPKPVFSQTQFRLSSIANSYDAMVSKVKNYKEELKISINFVQKYGGLGFWMPILHKISEVFRSDEHLKLYYEHLNFEESAMLQRGYQRILEGNYNLYYKKSLTTVHVGKGIDTAVFHAFIANVGTALDGYAISAGDIKTIIQRFRSFESCICPKS